jgi:hypothetical protein
MQEEAIHKELDFGATREREAVAQGLLLVGCAELI